jgi:CheY-like chemotaxis protein
MRADPTEQHTDTPETSRPSTLAVEDEEDIEEFLVAVIEQETPYHALHVPDAAHAFEVVRSLKPDLIIVDYHLPGIDGLELADRLHAMRGFDAIPTLMISSDPPPARALQERHIALLEKPFELNELLAAIEDCRR